MTLPPPMIQCAERCLLSMESEKARVKTCCIVLNNKNNKNTINKQIKQRSIRVFAIYSPSFPCEMRRQKRGKFGQFWVSFICL